MKLSERRFLPECHCMMDVGSLGLAEDTQTHTALLYTQTRRPAIFSQYKRIWANPQPNLPSIKPTSCAGAGRESGRPNPSVRGGRGVCHPPLWALSSWKTERRDRGWWSCAASGTGSSSCRKRGGQELRCGPREALQPKLAPPSSLSAGKSERWIKVESRKMLFLHGDVLWEMCNTVQRCKESLVITRDYDCEGNVTRVMTHTTGQSHAAQPGLRTVFSIVSTQTMFSQGCTFSTRPPWPLSALSQIFGWFNAWGRLLVLALHVP